MLLVAMVLVLLAQSLPGWVPMLGGSWPAQPLHTHLPEYSCGQLEHRGAASTEPQH